MMFNILNELASYVNADLNLFENSSGSIVIGAIFMALVFGLSVLFLLTNKTKKDLKATAAAVNGVSKCPYKDSFQMKDNTASKDVVRNIFKTKENQESVENIINSDSFKGLFDKASDIHDRAKMNDESPKECIFAQIMREIEEKRLKRVQEEQEEEEMNRRQEALCSRDLDRIQEEELRDGDEADDDEFNDDDEVTELTSKVKAKSFNLKVADQASDEQKLLFLNSTTVNEKMSTEDEIKCKQQQLERIFQLLKEQELIKNFEENIKQLNKEEDNKCSHLKDLNGTFNASDDDDCDYKFTIINNNFEEKEVELKGIFESQMKLYGLN